MVQANFKFISDAAGGDQFTVISFTGKEAISTLYQYEIEIRAPLSASILLDDVLDSPAKFISVLNDKEFPVYGILSDFQERQTSQDYVYYRAILVPRLWGLSIYKTNEIFTREQTVDKIIETVLDSANEDGAGIDYDLYGLSKNHLLSRDYVCQFGESDYDFISRLMENEGIFYYFDQTGGEAEKIIFINDMNYESITRPGLTFDMTLSTSNQYDCINAWSCRKQRLAAGVTVRDFNPDHPALDISDTSPIDQMGRGTEYIYGANIQDTDEATYLSEIRAEESLCKRTRYYGESSVIRLQSGHLFEMEMHPNDAYNGVEYLAVEVNHEGFHLDTSLSTGATKSPESVPQYRNSFVAINAVEQFRPARITHKPRFYGTMTAFIYAETGFNKAEVDEQGRYRVLLPFDRADGTKESTDPERKASTWIRMAQNYVGEGKGSYYPLTGGTEVLLSFINGDPDQPIIVGAVPNASEPSLLKSDNEFESTVQTGSGNRIRMGDVEGEDRIVMESPTANSWMRIGTPNDPYVVDADASTDGIKISTIGTFELESGTTATQKATAGNSFYAGSASSINTAISEYENEVKQECGVNEQGQALAETSKSAEQKTSTSENLLAKNILYSEGVTRIEAQKDCLITAQDKGIKLELKNDKLQIDTGGRELNIVCGNYTIHNKSESDTTHWATDTETFYGNKFEWMFGGTESFFVGGQVEMALAESLEVYAGLKQEFALAWSIELYLGAKHEFALADSLEWFTGMKTEIAQGAKIEVDLAVELESKQLALKNAVTKLQNFEITAAKTAVAITKYVAAEIKEGAVLIEQSGIKLM